MSPSRAQTYPDMWLDPHDDPRERDQIEITDERSNLREYLRAYRLTLRMKCDGLTPEQLATRSVPPSTLSLLGLVRHMAKVERDWFRRCAAGQDVSRLYWTQDDPEQAFAGAERAFGSWETAPNTAPAASAQAPLTIMARITTAR